MTRLAELWVRAVRSPAWPLFVLIVVGALLALNESRVLIRQEHLTTALGVGMALYAVGWLVVDWLLLRGIERRIVVAASSIAVVGAAAAAFLVEVKVGHHSRSTAGEMAVIAAAALVTAVLARGWLPRRSWGAQAVMALAVVSSAAFLTGKLGGNLLVDAKIYVNAGHAFLDGRPVYLTAPLTTPPVGSEQLPFVYPPFTVPVFAVLALLPPAVGPALLGIACGVSVVVGLRLLGAPWLLVPLLACWPPLAQGVYYGNMACVGFLALAAAWRFGAAAPLSGTFKAQSGLLALALVRERRWRALGLGLGLLALLVIATLPLTGIAMYTAWLQGLAAFQSTVTAFPTMMGISVQRTTGPFVAALVAVVAVAIAFVGRRRDGLARMAVASVIASPTVYLHGLGYILPSMLMVDSALTWGVAALMPWGSLAWIGIWTVAAIQVVGLTRSRTAVGAGATPAGAGATSAGAGATAGTGMSARASSSGTPENTAPPGDDVHPLGALLEPWPDRA